MLNDKLIAITKEGSQKKGVLNSKIKEYIYSRLQVDMPSMYIADGYEIDAGREEGRNFHGR